MLSKKCLKQFHTKSVLPNFKSSLKFGEVFCIFTKLKVNEYRSGAMPWFWKTLILSSSHQRCSLRKGVLRNFERFTGKQLCQSLFFNKVAGLRLWHRCFPVTFSKILRTPFLQNTSGRLLLYFS